MHKLKPALSRQLGLVVGHLNPAPKLALSIYVSLCGAGFSVNASGASEATSVRRTTALTCSQLGSFFLACGCSLLPADVH